MKSKKGFLVISEKSEKILIRKKLTRTSTIAFCINCRKEVERLTLEEIMLLKQKGAEDFENENDKFNSG